jgi:hypothetical protein
MREDQFDRVILIKNPSNLMILRIIFELLKIKVVGLSIQDQHCAFSRFMKDAEEES